MTATATATATAAQPQRPLDLRPLLRADLEWSSRQTRKTKRWLARDPISLKFFWFGDREYRLLQFFQGQRTLTEIRTAWQQQHALDPIDELELRQFALRLESQGVVQFAGAVSARRAEERLKRHRRRRWLSALGSPLAIRFPLLDPTPLLKRCDWIRLLFFRPTVLILALFVAFLIGVLTCALVSTRWIDRNLIEQLLVGDGVWYLLIGFILLKSMHELGHAMACRHFGGECHEIGVLFLVFIPCLYCDVSDAWKLKSRTARIMISAAGIIVELLCAAVAAIVWMSTQPSPVNSVAFSMMFVGSLSSVFVNGNPLLRYDGYYILSDLVGVPNLAQQSQESLHSLLRRIFFRNQLDVSHWDAKAFWLRVYGIAAWLYRCLLLAVIFLMLYHWLDPLGLQWLLLPMSAGILLASYVRVQQIARLMIRQSNDLRRGLASLTVAAIGCAGCVFFVVPLPANVHGRGTAVRTPRMAVYAPVDAVLRETLPDHERFDAGDTLLRLESFDLYLQQIATAGEVSALRQRIQDLAARQVDDPDAASQLATATQSLQKLRPQLEELNQRMDELHVVAPRSGILLAGDRVPMSLLASHVSTGAQPIEHGLDRAFQGAVFKRGVQLAVIGSSDQWNAEVLVEEAALRWIQVGASTQLRLDRRMNQLVHGTVQNISARPVSQTPEQLLLDPMIVSVTGADGHWQPSSPHYSVTIRVDSPEICPGDGAVLSARIATEPRILAVRFYEFVLQLLRDD